MVLMLAAALRAGSPWYLPAVGPVAMRFASVADMKPVVLPVSTSTQPSDDSHELIPDIPVEAPTNDVISAQSLMHDAPLNPESAGPLIGPMMDTNTVITPQMLLRFFAPAANGNSSETVIIPQTGFTPARPPAQSSTVKFSQPKP